MKPGFPQPPHRQGAGNLIACPTAVAATRHLYDPCEFKSTIACPSTREKRFRNAHSVRFSVKHRICRYADTQRQGKRRQGEKIMRGFLERLQWRMAAWMEGRYGPDNLSNALMVTGIVLAFASIIPGLDLLWIPALVLLIASMVRTFSKNIAKREAENASWLKLTAKPKESFALARKAWTNRSTTKYFKCKGCGAVLSVPRGKGKLRITCPKCHWQTEKKS